MEKLVNFLAVGLGGAVGSMMRYGVTLLAAALNVSGTFGTLFVNVAGSFLIGLLAGCCKAEMFLLMLSVGFCGGFTTFSTFSLQNVRLLQDGKVVAALLYMLLTVVICVSAAWLGVRAGQGR